MTRKPIRIFFSPMTGRFYATKAYKPSDKNPQMMVVTGEKFDVTNDIAAIIEQHGLKFERKDA